MIKSSISIIILISFFSLHGEARKVKHRDNKGKQAMVNKRLVKKRLGFRPGEKAFSFFLGQPSGIRYQQWLGFKKGYNLDLAYHTNEQVLVSANYLWYYYNVKDKIKRKDFWNATYFYYGPGLFTGKEFGDGAEEDDFLFGARVFIGLDYLFVNSNYSIRTEAALAKYIAGDDSFGFQLFVGFAYHWDRVRKKRYRKLR